MQRVLPPTLVLTLIIAMSATRFIWSSAQLPTSLRVFGAIVLLVGVAITVRHAAMFESVGTNIKTFNDPNQLVEAGAFAWTRNPMYLGFVMLLLGAAAMIGNAVAFVGPAVFFIAADRWYIPFEERRMHVIFGDDYMSYQQRVRRWVGKTS